MRRPTVHINLTKLAHKLLASPPKQWDIMYATTPTGMTGLVEQLQKERLEMTDAIFRSRYAAWL